MSVCMYLAYKPHTCHSGHSSKPNAQILGKSVVSKAPVSKWLILIQNLLQSGYQSGNVEL